MARSTSLLVHNLIPQEKSFSCFLEKNLYFQSPVLHLRSLTRLPETYCHHGWIRFPGIFLKGFFKEITESPEISMTTPTIKF